MANRDYTYVIVGGGLAAASAVEGIRERDRTGSVLLVSAERDLPYHRPPLSKKLWFGEKRLEEIFIHDRAFYEQNDVTLALGAAAVALDPDRKTVTDERGQRHGYEALLLATGGTPRRLPIPGGDLDGISYYRDLNDFRRTRGQAREGMSATVIGGGFIGSEIAAALNMNKLDVTMIFPSPVLCSRVFPASLGRALEGRYVERGVKVFSKEKPASIAARGRRFVTRTESGEEVESDLVIIGIGILPAVALAAEAGLTTGDGIAVNEHLETSAAGVYAAGDNARFPCRALGKSTRIEHWDNALSQGKCAGRNMAGAREPFTYLPYFFSDLFEFGYEAVGEVDSGLETFADWERENEKGVIYYLGDGRVRGVMLCNLWNKVDRARALIVEGERRAPESLRGAIG